MSGGDPLIRQLLPDAHASPDLEALYTQPPGVRLGMVASVDGSAAIGSRSGPLSSPADRTVFRLLRRACDVVLVGAGTARAEGYRPVRIESAGQRARAARGQRPLPPVAVVSRGRGLDAGSPLLAPGSDLLLLTTEAGARSASPDADVVVVGQEDVDPGRVLDALRERGLLRVLCEGGPALNGALLTAGLVDELCVTTSALLAGGQGPRLVTGAAEAARPLRLAHLLHADGELLARWTVERG